MAPLITALIPVLGTVLDRIFPDAEKAAAAKVKVMEMAQAGELAQLDADVRLALGQMEINKAEAASDDPFRAGWRPMTGWLCACGLGYTFLLQPLLPWLVALSGATVPPLPALDSDVLMTLLLGMLGLGSLRTVERVKGKV
jgi:hypothetical protein